MGRASNRPNIHRRKQKQRQPNGFADTRVEASTRPKTPPVALPRLETGLRCASMQMNVVLGPPGARQANELARPSLGGAIDRKAAALGLRRSIGEGPRQARRRRNHCLDDREVPPPPPTDRGDNRTADNDGGPGPRRKRRRRRTVAPKASTGKTPLWPRRNVRKARAASDGVDRERKVPKSPFGKQRGKCMPALSLDNSTQSELRP